MSNWEQQNGAPDPLGATWLAREEAYNFAIYSKHATSVTLLVYGPGDVARPLQGFPLDLLRNRSGRIWHCRKTLAELQGAAYYAYRMDGPPPRSQVEWHAFDPQKILLDPYAKLVYFPAAHDRAAATAPGPNDGRAPLGVLYRPAPYAWQQDRHVRHYSDLIIYELHVRGFTNSPSSGVAVPRRGSFAGVIDKIPYLRELGVTAVELMPVHQFDPQESNNYWGYSTLNFFAPHHRYCMAPDRYQQIGEFREMVEALHAAEIEVLLDVVYNHTTEGGRGGPTYSFKAIDNSTYYVMSGDATNPYVNFTGCGNTIHAANAAVRRLILDSLRYWVEEMHVDGFRFDLASTLTLNSDGSVNQVDPPLFDQIAADPVLNRVRLIAEQWTFGYDLRNAKFPGRVWSQWNGHFRDTVRCFVKSDPGQVPDLITRVHGSSDMLPDTLPDCYHPWQSINYVTCHDGFSLCDLVSFTDPVDDGWSEKSWDCGSPGFSNVPLYVEAIRQRQVKNFCCLLFLSNGIPMFRMGDEFLQTQQGHRNPYDIDSPLTWLDWNLAKKNAAFHNFFKKMIAFRKAHPSLGRATFWRDDVRWHGVGSSYDLSYDSHTLAFYLAGASQGDQDLYVMINAYWEPLTFTICDGESGAWWRVIDTALASPDDFCDPGSEVHLHQDQYTVQPRAVVVLIRK